MSGLIVMVVLVKHQIDIADRQFRVSALLEFSLLHCEIGRVAMYCCHQYSEGKHKAIAKGFGLTQHGSVSGSLTRIRQEIKQGRWRTELENVERELFIV